MFGLRGVAAALAATVLLTSAACQGQDGAPRTAAEAAAARVALTIETRSGTRRFLVELARTVAEQERGLMFRTNIPADGGMLFTPYPAAGGGPREASFWMKNTPSPLDILFIRPDGTIASIAADVEPFSEVSVRSTEPVSAVVEINGGKAAALGIAAGDRVSWTMPKD